MQYHRHRSHELPRPPHTFYHTARSLISRHRQMLLMMLGKKKSLVRTDATHEIQAAGARSGHNNPLQHRPVRADDEMSVRESETSRSAENKSVPPEVPVDSLKPETHHRQYPLVTSRSSAHHIHWAAMNILKNVPELTMVAIPHISLFINMVWGRCLKC